MKQNTHAWIALRATALLEDSGEAPELVTLLKPHARHAAIGAWIPDLGDAKRGGSAVENHVLKMAPHDSARFVVKKDDLMSRLGSYRRVRDLLLADESLDGAWWETPYRGDVVRPGQHLANRAMSMATVLRDLLLLGDDAVDALLPGDVAFADELDDETRIGSGQIALYLFMLSHFVADACQPCHCDARRLASYSNGKLHRQMEEHWQAAVGDDFDDATLCASDATPDEILELARGVDEVFDITFREHDHVPRVKDKDVWNETIYLCRASFALDSILAPPGEFPYDGDAVIRWDEVFADDAARERFDRAVLHDAVLNTAMYWRWVWEKTSKD